MQKTSYTEEKLPEIARTTIAEAGSKILCFHGEMGAGKTTLIKAIVAELNGADSASSPTFGIVNEYHTVDVELLGFHFDFYRIENEQEALDLGFEDYLNQDVWIFIEWPEKISSYIPEKSTHLHLTIVDPTTREIEMQ